jgi:ABC-type glutathione transport system ATPase component
VIPERLRRRAAGLRHWADGVPAQLAAVELLVSFGAGRLVDGPWVRPGGFGSFWFDPDVAAEAGGHLSGGERRVLAIASSLASAVHPVDLSDAVTGLDPDALRCVLDALACAGGHSATTDAPEWDHNEPR